MVNPNGDHAIDSSAMKNIFKSIGIAAAGFWGMQGVQAQEAINFGDLQPRADLSITIRTPSGEMERLGIIRLGESSAPECSQWCASIGGEPLSQSAAILVPEAFEPFRETGFWTKDETGELNLARLTDGAQSQAFAETKPQCVWASAAFKERDRD